MTSRINALSLNSDSRDFATIGDYFDAVGNAHYTHADYQGSIIAVTDSAGTVVQTTNYYPYGEPWREPTGQPMLFGGKERTSLADYLFGPRNLMSAALLWTAPDSKAQHYTSYSPYTFCAGNPVFHIEIDGNWYIKVSASENRGLHPYAMYTVYNSKNEVLFRTVAKVRGTSRDRSVTNADTPVGYYKLDDWHKTGPNTRYSNPAYGKNYVLRQTYLPNQEGGNRNGIHTHAGGDLDNGLKGTHDCIRLSEEDIMLIKGITDNLESSDSSEKMEDLLLLNDLEEPIEFNDRDEIMNSVTILLEDFEVVLNNSK